MVVRLGEMVADEPVPPLRVELPAVEGDDAGGLLAAMLQRVQPERRDGRRIRMAVDAEHAAFLAQCVRVAIAQWIVLAQRAPGSRLDATGLMRQM